MKLHEMSQQLYLIALLPAEDLRAEVRELKLEMQRRYGSGHALKSPAHITLQMPFRLDEQQENALCDLLRHFAAGQTPFSTMLDGFDCFSPRVIFLLITDHEPLFPLQVALKKALIESGIIPEPPRAFPFHPHMTIATRDLKPETFEKAWPEYRERSFRAKIHIQSFFLLKHNGRHWEIFREFGFGRK